MCLSNLRDKNSGVLTAVSEDVHAVDVASSGRAEERGQRAHLIRIPPAPGGDQLKLVFCRFRLIVDELLVHGREIAAGRDRQDAAVLFREARHIFLREVDHELLGHGVGETRMEELALLVLRFACHRQQPVIEVRLIPCLECLCPFVCLRHGVGSDGGEIDYHAAIGQSRIERLDHIDRTDRIDFIAIFNNTAEAFTFEKK